VTVLRRSWGTDNCRYGYHCLLPQDDWRYREQLSAAIPACTATIRRAMPAPDPGRSTPPDVSWFIYDFDLNVYIG
jgi:hypothetical protein